MLGTFRGFLPHHPCSPLGCRVRARARRRAVRAGKGVGGEGGADARGRLSRRTRTAAPRGGRDRRGSGGGDAPARRRLGGQAERDEEPTHGVGRRHRAQDPAWASAARAHEGRRARTRGARGTPTGADRASASVPSRPAARHPEPPAAAPTRPAARATRPAPRAMPWSRRATGGGTGRVAASPCSGARPLAHPGGAPGHSAPRLRRRSGR